MNKIIFLSNLDNVIQLSNENEKKSQFPYLYKNASNILKKIKQDIQVNDHDGLQSDLNSLGQFAVREVDNYDNNFSQKLCEIASGGRKFFD